MLEPFNFPLYLNAKASGTGICDYQENSRVDHITSSSSTNTYMQIIYIVFVFFSKCHACLRRRTRAFRLPTYTAEPLKNDSKVF